MFPLHAGHSHVESALVVALCIVLVGAAFALTREGWSRVGALVGVAAVAGGSRLGVAVVGIHGRETLHLLGHGLELSALALVLLAGYYALFDLQMAAPTEE